MGKYHIAWTATIWIDKDIEADTKEEAEAKFHEEFPNDAYEQFDFSELLSFEVTKRKGE